MTLKDPPQGAPGTPQEAPRTPQDLTRTPAGFPGGPRATILRYMKNAVFPKEKHKSGMLWPGARTSGIAE